MRWLTSFWIWIQRIHCWMKQTEVHSWLTSLNYWWHPELSLLFPIYSMVMCVKLKLHSTHKKITYLSISISCDVVLWQCDFASGQNVKTKYDLSTAVDFLVLGLLSFSPRPSWHEQVQMWLMWKLCIATSTTYYILQEVGDETKTKKCYKKNQPKKHRSKRSK